MSRWLVSMSTNTHAANCPFSLRIMGGHNKVLVDASLAAIDIMGGHNRVTWSAAKNPRRPRVTNLGNNNKVGSDQ